MKYAAKMVAVLLALMMVVAIPLTALAAEEKSIVPIYDFHKYFNAVLLSSKVPAADSYALGDINATLRDDGYYTFSKKFSNQATIEGVIDQDGNIFSLYITANTKQMITYTKYIMFSAVSAVEFRDKSAMVDRVQETCNALGLLRESFDTEASGTTEHKSGEILYRFEIDQEEQQLTLSILPA